MTQPTLEQSHQRLAHSLFHLVGMLPPLQRAAANLIVEAWLSLQLGMIQEIEELKRASTKT